MWFPFGTAEQQTSTIALLSGTSVAPFVQDIISAFQPVLALDAWTLVSSAAATPGSKTVSAGTSRVLLYAVSNRNGVASAGAQLTAVSYGGQAMTQVERTESAGPGTDTEVSLWILDEAGIAAASGTAFTITHGNTGAVQYRAFAGSYEVVDQATPVLDSFAAIAASGAAPTASALTTGVGGVVLGFIGNSEGSNTSTPDVTAWGGGLTELLENTGTASYASLAELLDATGANVTPSPTVSGFANSVLIGASFKALEPQGGFTGVNTAPFVQDIITVQEDILATAVEVAPFVTDIIAATEKANISGTSVAPFVTDSIAAIERLLLSGTSIAPFVTDIIVGTNTSPSAGIAVESRQAFDNSFDGADAAIQDLITGTGTTRSFDINIPAGLGNNIGVLVTWGLTENNFTLSSATLGGVAATTIITGAGSGAGGAVGAAYFALGNSPTSGDRTCSLTFSGTPSAANSTDTETVLAFAAILSGAAQTSPTDGTNAATEASFYWVEGFGINLSITPANDGAYIALFVEETGNSASQNDTTTGDGFTARTSGGRPGFCEFFDQIQATAATKATEVFTSGSSSTGSAIMVAIKEA